MTEILLQDVAFITDSNADDVGRVFSWNGRLLRAVHEEHVDEVEELLSSGLLQELIVAKLFPEVRKTNCQLSGYGLILEHERIPVVTYPYEWSFTMFKDAAIVMLRVNQIAMDYGYQTKDGHGYNILFHGSHPLFIDLGSFVKMQPGYRGWQGYEEFLRFFYYPLILWCEGNEFLARRVLSGGMQPLMPHDSFLAYRFPLLRNVNERFRQRIAHFQLLITRVSNVPKEDLKRIWPGRKGVLLQWLRPVLTKMGGAFDLSTLLKKVQGLEFKASESTWGSYQMQSDLVDESGEIRPSDRFKRVAGQIGQCNLEDVVELAGNQGAFARYLLSETEVKSVTCTDYDAYSIDTLYRTIGSEQQGLTPAVLDFMAPAQLAETRPAHERMKAEAVLALAVTHHLLLTQRLTVDAVLAKICQYAERYVFVEFMPLGLYGGRSTPNVPDWYNLEWFRAACVRHFKIVTEEQLEENRILIVGRLK